MAQQVIGIGTSANDGTGDPLRTAFTKANANFTELYTAVAVAYQPLDGDLTALAALAGTSNLYYRSAANTWTAVTFTSPVTFSGGALSVAASSTSASGIVELATSAETITGTDTVRAITPQALSDFFANGQLAFPATQNPSAGANTLDDYEEGTITPGAAYGGASVGVTYGSQTGRYTKVGRLYQVEGAYTLTSKGSSAGAATITGMPGTAAVTSPCVLASTTGMSGLTAGVIGVFAGSGTIGIRTPGTGSSGAAADTNFSNTANLEFNGTFSV